MKIAEGLVNQGEFVAAARVFKSAAVNGDPDARLLRRQAEVLIRAGRRRDAADPARRAAALLPDDESSQIFAAQVLLSVRGFDEVADRMTAWLDKHPDSVNAWIAFGNAKAGLSTPIRALAQLAMARTADELRIVSQSVPRSATAAADAVAAEAFQRAMRVAPDAVDARIAWANFLVATQRVEEAKGILEEVLPGAPERPVVYHALGTYYWLNGRSAEAETYLRVAAAAPGYGRRAAATLSLASLYDGVGRKADVIAVIRALPPEVAASEAVTLSLARLEARSGEIDAALRRLDGLAKRKSAFPELMTSKASLLLEAGRYADAVVAARAAVDLSPNASQPHSILGRALLASGDLENAFDELDGASRLAPGDARLALDLIHLAIELGRPQDLLIRAQDAARLLPDDPAALAAPAAVLLASNDFRLAEQSLSPHLRKHPSSPALLTLMGRIQARLERPDEARVAFMRALHASPGDADALSGIAFVEMAQGQFEAARRGIDEALAAHSTNADYLYVAARVHQAAGDEAGHEQLLRRALEADPAHLSALLDLLSPNFVQEHAAEATHALERLLTRRPRALEARDRLAGLYERSGRSAEARAQYERIVKEGARQPDSAVVSRAAARLSSFDAR